jgi:hypothetical protein
MMEVTVVDFLGLLQRRAVRARYPPGKQRIPKCGVSWTAGMGPSHLIREAGVGLPPLIFGH